MYEYLAALALAAVLCLTSSGTGAGKKPPSLTDRAGQFVKLLVKGDFSGAEKDFDKTMKAALPSDKLKSTWQGLISQVGAFKKQVGTRTGKVSAKGVTYDVVYVTCDFARSKVDVKVVYDGKGQISGLFFVPPGSAAEPALPPYACPEAFSEQPITVGSPEWALPGTLALPKGPGPFPALVLVHGSGPQDRDETVGPNRPFRDLAWGLASLGIAVLRYDKRTLAHASRLTSMKGSFTVDQETVEDALSAADRLRHTPRIDPKRVFVLGHSLGGMMIPRIGKRDPELAGLIVMAGTTRPLEEVLRDQVAYITGLGTASAADRAQLEQIERELPNIRALTPADGMGGGAVFLGAPASYWLDLRDYRPAEEARDLRRPMLILQGERDYQVTQADLANWKAALGSRPDVQIITYPDLNHLFISGHGKIAPAEYAQPGHVAAQVIEDVARWIRNTAPAVP